MMFENRVNQANTIFYSNIGEPNNSGVRNPILIYELAKIAVQRNEDSIFTSRKNE